MPEMYSSHVFVEPLADAYRCEIDYFCPSVAALTAYM